MTEYLKNVDDLNRSYLWRILFDQVRLKRMPPIKFIEIVVMHFLDEKVEAIIPYILGQVSFILSMGLINKEEKDKALDFVLQVYEKKMLANVDNKSMVNMILNYYIGLCPKSKNDILLSMATRDCLPGQEKIKVNKRQRYACLRKLLKFKTTDVQPLFEKEQERDFSDADHIAKL